MNDAIRVRGLTKNYGNHTALRGVDLDVPAGQVYGVIGPNGAGKTTTMRILLDLVRPTAGEVAVLGEHPRTGGAALRRRIGFLPGELRLAGRMSGRAFLAHYASISGTVPRHTAETYAERLGVDLSRPVRSLSKGNKQKLGLIQAFMHSPELLVLDEPTSGLDPLVQREFHSMLREARERGATVFLSSHVLSEVQLTADRVAILRRGSIAAVSTVDQLREGAVRNARIALDAADADALVRDLSTLIGVTGTRRVEATAGQSIVEATVDTHVDEFVKAVSRHRIHDLTLEEPDLEAAVLKFYDEER
ncbi:ABC transporter ATP-binding protein [Homoserinibacter sp. GY 40078]|uniref:ABC transporter ATP-binding protein n=1 Tax=Homoserinibacter sp. GY 40078 TaxID=2603275 RepID=UPI0011C80D6B|nr:ABC transporter ATP-binding protein [Homoserinibacter sp. GY 40078]TXK19748.1 ABC transporter ATP-binding protein [Homoserinibacter sp. GY 40078]